MKKMMVYAYTRYNLGDDLFIKVLCERYKDTRFIIYAPKKYKYLFKNIKNIRCISSESIINRSINFLFRKLGNDNFMEKYLAKRCDGGVYIGGSLFIQGENWKHYFEKYEKNKKYKDRPFYVLGANFGPYKDDEYYNKYKMLFSTYDDVCFRENYSYDLFKDLPNIRLSDDIVFQYNKPDVKEKNRVAISVIKPSYREHLKEYDVKYYNKIKDIVIEFIDKDIYVDLISFCKIEGDEEAIMKIIDLIPKEYIAKIKIHYYSEDIDNIIKVIAESKYVIASRFHAMILGWTFSKRVLPIVYSSKMTNVMNDVGFNGLYIDFENISNISIDCIFEYFNKDAIDVNKQIKNSSGQFEKLDIYLS